MLPVQVKILDARIGTEFKMPNYQSDMAAGIDLLACIDKPLTLRPDETQLISTGISVWVDDPNYCSVILPRSGLGHKHGVVLGNLVGLIDADYQGPLMVSMWNRNNVYYDWGGKPMTNNNSYTILPGERIAQLVFLPIARAKFEVVKEFHANTVRGAGGFGSTGG